MAPPDPRPPLCPDSPLAPPPSVGMASRCRRCVGAHSRLRATPPRAREPAAAEGHPPPGAHQPVEAPRQPHVPVQIVSLQSARAIRDQRGRVCRGGGWAGRGPGGWEGMGAREQRGGQKLQGQNEGGSVGPRAQGQDAQGLPCASVARPKPRAPSLWPPLPPCCPAEASTVAGSCRLAGPLPSSQNIPAPCVTGPSALSQKSQRGAEAPPGGGDHGRQWGLGSLCPGTAQGPFQSPC